MGRTSASRRVAPDPGARGGHGLPRPRRRLRPEAVLPLLRRAGDEYVGVDVDTSEGAELVGRVESLPVGDGEFDLVLCTQVLEHCDDPAQAVRELRRVTAPGGRCSRRRTASSGTTPSPVDYWRWTHEGLRRLFTTNAEWGSIAVEPSGGTAACLAMLVGAYAELGLGRVGLRPLARGPVWLLNRAAAALDRRFPLAGRASARLADGELPRRRHRRRLMRLFRRNAIGFYAVYAAAMVSGLVVTPILLDAIGTEAFGIWAFIGGITIYLAVLDFGLGPSVVRFTAEAHGRARPGGDQPRHLRRPRPLRGDRRAHARRRRRPRLVRAAADRARPPDLVWDARVSTFLVTLSLALRFPLGLFYNLLGGRHRFDLQNLGELRRDRALRGPRRAADPARRRPRPARAADDPRHACCAWGCR